MKKIDNIKLDNLIDKLLKETLQDKVEDLESKINEMDDFNLSDEEIDELMSSIQNNDEITEETEEGIYDVSKNFPKEQSFDYVQEDDDTAELEDDEEEKDNQYDDETCKYHLKNFGPDNERTIKFCGTDKLNLGKYKFSMNEIKTQDLEKGKKYKYRFKPNPEEEDELEYDYEVEYEPETSKHYKFKGKKYGTYMLPDKFVSDFVDEIDEELYGKQHKIDVAEPKGKITSADFKKLRKMKEGKEVCEQCGSIMKEGKCMECNEGYMDEGNAFTGKLKQTKKGGKFKLGGKTYKDTSTLDESEKFIQKATEKIEKKGTEGKFGSWCKRNGLASEEGEVTKACIDKAMKSDNPSVVKMANFAKNIKGYSGSKHKKKSVKLKESEMIDLIEKIINEQNNESKEQLKNIKKAGTSKGLDKYNQVHKKDGDENKKALEATAKKMKEYLKDGSKGTYDTNPDIFPKGNGELAKMSKKAYVPSNAVKDYTDNFTAAGLENLDYDEIQPNEEWVSDNIVGSSRTGNNPEWANTGKTDVNKKRNEIRKNNLLAKMKRKAYNKAPQPAIIDKTGEDEGDKIMKQLESKEVNKSPILNEEFDRMKKLITYNQRTQ